jgi:hypothetical protein
MALTVPRVLSANRAWAASLFCGRVKAEIPVEYLVNSVTACFSACRT